RRDHQQHVEAERCEAVAVALEEPQLELREDDLEESGDEELEIAPERRALDVLEIARELLRQDVLDVVFLDVFAAFGILFDFVAAVHLARADDAGLGLE